MLITQSVITKIFTKYEKEVYISKENNTIQSFCKDNTSKGPKKTPDTGSFSFLFSYILRL